MQKKSNLRISQACLSKQQSHLLEELGSKISMFLHMILMTSMTPKNSEYH